MISRRQFLLRGGSLGLALVGTKFALSAFPDDDTLPDGSQSRGMITRAAQDAIDRGLGYLEGQQHADGSFGTITHTGNVAITSLCGLAFMAGGHQPGRGRYGRVVTRALEYLVNLEQGSQPPGFLYNSRAMQNGPMYGHGFGTLFLAEAYGMVQNPQLRERMRGTLSRSSPAGRSRSAPSDSNAPRTSSRAGSRRATNRAPSSVRPTLRVVRMKSAVPMRASSARTAWLIADGVTPSSAAALRKLRCRATVKNASTPSNAPCLTVKFCFMAYRHYRG